MVNVQLLLMGRRLLYQNLLETSLPSHTLRKEDKEEKEEERRKKEGEKEGGRKRREKEEENIRLTC